MLKTGPIWPIPCLLIAQPLESNTYGYLRYFEQTAQDRAAEARPAQTEEFPRIAFGRQFQSLCFRRDRGCRYPTRQSDEMFVVQYPN